MSKSDEFILKALELSEAKFRELFNNMQNAVAVYQTSDGGETFSITDFNRAAEKIEQVKRDQVVGKDVALVFPGIKEFGLLDVFRKVWVTGHPESFPVQAYTDDRISGWRENFVYKLPSGEIVAVYTDLTEQKNAELELKKSEERWQFAIEGTGDGLWDWNVKTGEVYFSDQWKNMLGYERNEIRNDFSEWEIRVHPEDLEPAKVELKKHLEGKTAVYQSEHRLLAKDGSYRWILDRGKVMSRDKDGQPLRVIGTHTDITERKNVEHRLELVQFGIDHARIGVYQIEEDGAIIYVNHFAAESLGYTPEEMIGKYIFEIDQSFNPETFKKHRAEVRKAGSHTILSQHLRKDGTQFPVEVTVTYFTFHDKTFSFSFVSDVSKRLEAESALRKMKDDLEIQVQEKTIELTNRIDQMERIHEATIDREFRIKELLDEIRKLKSK